MAATEHRICARQILALTSELIEKDKWIAKLEALLSRQSEVADMLDESLTLAGKRIVELESKLATALDSPKPFRHPKPFLTPMDKALGRDE